MDPTHFSYILMGMVAVFCVVSMSLAIWADKRNAAADDEDEDDE